MREKIRLVSSAGTGHFYTTDKNKSAMPDKMEIKKFDPVKENTSFIPKQKLNNSCGFFNQTTLNWRRTIRKIKGKITP